MLHYLIVEKLVDFEENRAAFCFGLDLLFRFAKAIGLVQNIAEIPQKCGVRFYKEASRLLIDKECFENTNSSLVNRL